LQGAEDLAVLPTRFLEYVLWRDEAVRDEPPKPVRDMVDIVIAFLFVHGLQDLAQFGLDGGVVALASVEERAVASGGGNEVIWTSHCHDPRVVLDEGLGNVSCLQQGDDRWDVTILACIVVPEELYSVCNAEVVWMRHARKAYALSSLRVSWVAQAVSYSASQRKLWHCRCTHAQMRCDRSG
jgi:hypothetical protein